MFSCHTFISFKLCLLWIREISTNISFASLNGNVAIWISVLLSALMELLL